VLGVYDVGDLDAIRRYNAIELDGDDRLTFFEEKPEQPRSTLTGIALYFYPRRSLGLVGEYLESGNNPDQPGRLVQWLYPRTPVYAWRVPGRWYDIGSAETLAEADAAFSGG
jgi:glucose-1-phosphate thymidylyltransferase